MDHIFDDFPIHDLPILRKLSNQLHHIIPDVLPHCIKVDPTLKRSFLILSIYVVTDGLFIIIMIQLIHF